MPPLSINSLSYTLVKYSRAHPAHSPAQSSNGVSDISQSWQHYTGPAIKLHLDTKKHLDGRFASVHLRVAWFLDNNARQPDMIFLLRRQEDVDLLEFSSLPPQNYSDVQSLPLKAIYRDNVIGMRYLHPTRIQPGTKSGSRIDDSRLSFKPPPKRQNWLGPSVTFVHARPASYRRIKNRTKICLLLGNFPDLTLV
ncbi:hypothetical protein CONPUDRAFT_71689 [Coniophora puteana RWD-64-598 SS2]|uniref:Uncharacterized protein n=1 Tax=Coniophora puteana (strain RWD-64-598) TaxID=741705 RepID=A0A5M3MWH3_CONPW|nr:uncharacterized protein CONPUDRAFT_71689 [Coniophora puteana RWD-64-598 SS2]EIW83055.1 hypothetical protein CONPUDRAFT_71689 [Coniophora puteana RWD-64-598 SS2]